MWHKENKRQGRIRRQDYSVKTKENTYNVRKWAWRNSYKKVKMEIMVPGLKRTDCKSLFLKILCKICQSRNRSHKIFTSDYQFGSKGHFWCEQHQSVSTGNMKKQEWLWLSASFPFPHSLFLLGQKIPLRPLETSHENIMSKHRSKESGIDEGLGDIVLHTVPPHTSK